MAGSVNKVILIGNLGADPEVKTFQDGNSIANIRIATSESYTNQAGEKINNTEWHNVVLRRGLAGIAEKYLKKGDKVYIEGALKTRKWQDQNSVDRYTVEIIAQNMTMLSPRNEGSNSGIASQAPAASDMGSAPTSTENEGNNNDDLPF
jgi:single-strand DNA-binding protein